MSTLLQVLDLRKSFRQPWRPGAAASAPPAVDGVSFSLGSGEALGLVGESGSGKSTTALLVARLLDADAGRILLEGEDLAGVPVKRAARAHWRGRVQMVFQDPGESLPPAATAFEAIAMPLQRLRGFSGQQLARAVHAAAEAARLPAALLQRYPHQLSGGQAARVGIARALAPEPSLLILDEPTSALDVSVQVGILQLLDRLRSERGLSYLFISHDLQVVRLLCQRTVVMRNGLVVESGATQEVLANPRQAYTRQLVAAIPRLA